MANVCLEAEIRFRAVGPARPAQALRRGGDGGVR